MKPLPERVSLVRILAAVALTASSLALVFLSFGQPLGYDESYNLQIVHNLLHGHGYATDRLLAAADEPRQFDFRITTGPSLLLPVAGAVVALGEHVWVYRLVPCLFFLLLVALWFREGARAVGFWAGAAAAAAVIALNTAAATYGVSPMLGPGDVLGEVAAAALLLGACGAVRRPTNSGLLLGLAVLAKTVVLIGLPAVLLVALSVARRSGQPVLGTMLRFAGSAVAPILVWQVFRFATLGSGDAQEVNAHFVSFLRTGGSGISGASVGGPLSRVATQVELVTIPGAVLVLVLAVLAVFGSRGACSQSQEKPPTSQLSAIVAAVAAGLTIESWWLFYSGLDWVRHSLIGVYLLVPGVSVLAVRSLVAAKRRTLHLFAGVIIAGAFAFAIGMHVRDMARPSGPTLAAQRDLAARLASGNGDYMFSGHSQLADLTLLGAPEPRRLDEGGGLVILRLPGATPNLWYHQEQALCVEVVFEQAGYVGCSIAPGSVPKALIDGSDLPAH